MIHARLDQLERGEYRSEDDPTLRAGEAYPLCWRSGAVSSSLVYLELEPGHHLGPHVHSVEETLLVLDGTVEASVGGESQELPAGGIAVAPALVAHDVRNAGTGTARFVGFFASAAVLTIFEQAIEPGGERVAGTPAPELPGDYPAG